MSELYLTCNNEVEEMDFKTEAMVKKVCGCETYNLVQREDIYILKCTECGREVQI